MDSEEAAATPTRRVSRRIQAKAESKPVEIPTKPLKRTRSSRSRSVTRNIPEEKENVEEKPTFQVVEDENLVETPKKSRRSRSRSVTRNAQEKKETVVEKPTFQIEEDDLIVENTVPETKSPARKRADRNRSTTPTRVLLARGAAKSPARDTTTPVRLTRAARKEGYGTPDQEEQKKLVINESPELAEASLTIPKTPALQKFLRNWKDTKLNESVQEEPMEVSYAEDAGSQDGETTNDQTEQKEEPEEVTVPESLPIDQTWECEGQVKRQNILIQLEKTFTEEVILCKPRVLRMEYSPPIESSPESTASSRVGQYEERASSEISGHSYLTESHESSGVSEKDDELSEKTQESTVAESTENIVESTVTESTVPETVQEIEDTVTEAESNGGEDERQNISSGKETVEEEIETGQSQIEKIVLSPSAQESEEVDRIQEDEDRQLTESLVQFTEPESTVNVSPKEIEDEIISPQKDPSTENTLDQMDSQGNGSQVKMDVVSIKEEVFSPSSARIRATEAVHSQETVLGIKTEEISVSGQEPDESEDVPVITTDEQEESPESVELVTVAPPEVLEVEEQRTPEDEAQSTESEMIPVEAETVPVEPAESQESSELYTVAQLEVQDQEQSEQPTLPEEITLAVPVPTTLEEDQRTVTEASQETDDQKVERKKKKIRALLDEMARVGNCSCASEEKGDGTADSCGYSEKRKGDEEVQNPEKAEEETHVKVPKSEKRKKTKKSTALEEDNVEQESLKEVPEQISEPLEVPKSERKKERSEAVPEDPTGEIQEDAVVVPKSERKKRKRVVAVEEEIQKEEEEPNLEEIPEEVSHTIEVPKSEKKKKKRTLVESFATEEPTQAENLEEFHDLMPQSGEASKSERKKKRVVEEETSEEVETGESLEKASIPVPKSENRKKKRDEELERVELESPEEAPILEEKAEVIEAPQTEKKKKKKRAVLEEESKPDDCQEGALAVEPLLEEISKSEKNKKKKRTVTEEETPEYESQLVQEAPEEVPQSLDVPKPEKKKNKKRAVVEDPVQEELNTPEEVSIDQTEKVDQTEKKKKKKKVQPEELPLPELSETPEETQSVHDGEKKKKKKKKVLEASTTENEPEAGTGEDKKKKKLKRLHEDIEEPKVKKIKKKKVLGEVNGQNGSDEVSGEKKIKKKRQEDIEEPKVTKTMKKKAKKMVDLEEEAVQAPEVSSSGITYPEITLKHMFSSPKECQSGLKGLLQSLYAWNNRLEKRPDDLPDTFLNDDSETIWQFIAHKNRQINKDWRKNKNLLDEPAAVDGLDHSDDVEDEEEEPLDEDFGDDDELADEGEAEIDEGEEEDVDLFNLKDEDLKDLEHELEQERDSGEGTSDEKENDRPKQQQKKYPKSAVDDKFFNLAEMDAFCDEAEKQDDEEGLLATVDDSWGGPANYRYEDFFGKLDDVVGGGDKKGAKKRKVEDSVRKDAKKKKSVRFALDDENKEEEPEDDENEEETTKNGKIKALPVLLGQQEKDEKMDSKLKMDIRKLQETIRKLEDENLEPRKWEMSGEVTAQQRSENELLETHLQFDNANKRAPEVTEDFTEKIEAMIKQRIKDQAFDDVVRIKKVDEKVDIYRNDAIEEQEMMKKSLAEVYEKDYQKAAGEAAAAVAENPKHKEIEEKWQSLSLKIDALYHFEYAPPTVRPEVKVVSNMAALRVEEVGMQASTDAQLLAPEEMKKRQKGDLKADDERSKTDKLRERRKKKTKQRAMVLKVGAEKALAGQLETKIKKKTKVAGKADKEENLKSSNFFSKLQDTVQKEIKEKTTKKKKVKSTKVVAGSSKFKL